MENKIIFCGINTIKILKIVFFVGLLGVMDFVNARSGGGQGQSQTTSTTGSTTPVSGAARKSKTDTTGFSSFGKSIVEQVEVERKGWKKSWDAYINTLPANSKEKIGLETLRKTTVKKLKAKKESSTIEEMLRRSEVRQEQQARTIEALTRQLAQARRGMWDSVYDYAMSWGKSLGVAGLGTAGAYAFSLSAAPIAAVGVAGLLAHRGFESLKSELKSGRLSNVMGGITGEILIAQLIGDSGRYPTFPAKKNGLIDGDIQDTEGLGNDFETYCKNVLNDIENDQKTVYSDFPDIKAMDEKIDEQIALIRHQYADEDPVNYMSKIESGENIVRARAAVSEYLRTGFKIQQLELLEKNKKEETKKKEEAEKKAKESSWWSNYLPSRMG